MKDKNIKKRIWAYIIDFTIVGIISALLVQTPLNPYFDSYNADIEEYEVLYENYKNNLNTLSDVYSDKDFTVDELEKLKEIETLKDTLENENLDLQNVENLYDTLKDKLNLEFSDKSTEIMYNQSKHSIIANIINLIVIIVYFVGFAYIAKGQTFGKRMFKLQIQSQNGSSLSILNYFLRAAILYDLITPSLDICALLLLDKNTYLMASSILSLFAAILEVAVAYTIFNRDSKCGLHDKIAKTCVTNLGEEIKLEDK